MASNLQQSQPDRLRSIPTLTRNPTQYSQTPTSNRGMDPSEVLNPSLAIANKSESEFELSIARPVFSDLLTDYNTIKNTDIPPPLWATLDADYCEMVCLPTPAPPQNNRIEGLSSIDTDQYSESAIIKADGTPLRRVPLIRARKHFTIEDEDEDEDNNRIIDAQPIGSLRELKEAAARRRAAKPSPMAIATEEAKARVAAAREARSAQMARIDEWGAAVVQLNRQRDEVVVRIADERSKMLSGGQGKDAARITYRILNAKSEDQSAGTSVELEEDEENARLIQGLAGLDL